MSTITERHVFCGPAANIAFACDMLRFTLLIECKDPEDLVKRLLALKLDAIAKAMK